MKIQNKYALFLLCKIRYIRNGQNLKSLKIIKDGRFYIYNVGGMHIASEAFNWYLTEAVLAQEVRRVSCRYYTPKPGDTVVDIGAGLGEETCVYTTLVGQLGKVYAIEANPQVYDTLYQVVKLNKFTNVEPYNMAINNITEKVRIDDAPTSYLSSSLNNISKGTVYEVDGIPFKEFCASHAIKEIDLLKVNIEGAERFLKTAFADSRLTIHNVAIACHDFRYAEEGNEFFRTKQLVNDYLNQYGYETWSQQIGIPHIDDWVYGKKLTP
ncbi:FkbM family methyltransferase [Hymenobacter sp. BT770]|uniref:FkbM family methyltransferase n=1 Tax=Hymenobacter sp. BT770 TaxID=2886942 RepID=UPI001D0F6532|nr:FkbM family methyltransferase [Hymenobacter sp. BT770]MCC3154451.1 FkbM family methyltransferase [Hymenobacter sp. BT770]MDO3416484.1 FkbM family methyltransferase [Hymenobacter sp. BT770]